MSKRSHKALASATVMSLILTSTLTATNVQAASSVERVAGGNREATAASVATSAFPDGAETVVLVNGYGYGDAVSATPLAKALNAPILLTNNVNTPSADLIANLTTLKAKKVVIVGGEGVVPKALADKLASSYTVERIGGNNRYETNAKVAEKVLELTGKKEAFLVNGQDGYADALSVASIAATKGMPVLFANKNEVPAEVKAVAKDLKVSAVGGDVVLPQSVVDSIGATKVVNKGDRFSTNLEVLKTYKDDLKFDNMYMAFGGQTSNQFADALVASAAAAKVGAPLILSGNKDAAEATTNAKAYLKENLKDSKVYLVGGEASLEKAIEDSIKDIINPVKGDLAVDSIKAASANSFKVTFNKAVEDTSKVTFEVKRSTTPVTVTANWNADKTEATLAASSNLPEGSYTVAVKNDTKEMKTETIAITQQKVAKIDITSKKLSVYRDTTKNPVEETGYATYKVTDQYGNDITNSYLANNITFQTGVGTVNAKNGVIKITPATQGSLIQFANVVITGYDTTTGISVSATLETSTAVGTLSDIKLGEMKDITLTAGDVTSVYYIPYTAYDMSGNETKNYELVSKGLITDKDGKFTTVSNPYVEVRVVQDPADSNKAALEVKVTKTDNIYADMPVSIMAMTYTGKQSTINTTIKKANEVETFTLMAPAFNIAAGDKDKEIPFEAYDQAGNKITKYSDIDGKVTFSDNLRLDKNPDGTAKLVLIDAGTDKAPIYLNANVTKTGKMSNIIINVQEKAVAETLELDSSVFVNAMENGATQDVDLGADAGGLKVKDQYGREINMVTSKNNYKVAVTTTTTTGAPISITNDAVLGNGNYTATINAHSANGASDTVTFTLFEDKEHKDSKGNTIARNGVLDEDEKIDTKAVSLSVVKTGDIKSYTIDEVKDPIYANSTKEVKDIDIAVEDNNAREKAYAATLKVYGKTSAGAKVLLNSNNKPVVGAYVSDSADFVTYSNGEYDGTKVVAGKIADPTKTSAETTATVTLNHNGALHALTTTIKSSTEAPKATDMGFEVKSFDKSTGKDVVLASADGDVVTIYSTWLLNKRLTKYMPDGTKATDASKLTFFAKDQYGKKAMKLARFDVISHGRPDADGVLQPVLTNKATIDADGVITGDIKAKDQLTISAVSTNGLIKTIKVIVK